MTTVPSSNTYIWDIGWVISPFSSHEREQESLCQHPLVVCIIGKCHTGTCSVCLLVGVPCRLDLISCTFYTHWTGTLPIRKWFRCLWALIISPTLRSYWWALLLVLWKTLSHSSCSYWHHHAWLYYSQCNTVRLRCDYKYCKPRQKTLKWHCCAALQRCTLHYHHWW